MDHELTKKMRAWLETPEEQRDLEEGALLVLQLSNNRIMYQGFMRNLKRSAKMIAYQLQKYYNFRVKDLTHQEVVEMTAEVKKIPPLSRWDFLIYPQQNLFVFSGTPEISDFWGEKE